MMLKILAFGSIVFSLLLTMAGVLARVDPLIIIGQVWLAAGVLLVAMDVKE